DVNVQMAKRRDDNSVTNIIEKQDWLLEIIFCLKSIFTVYLVQASHYRLA
ncbi:19838_t:CDS:1, partial [Racocetra persica]